MYIAVYFAVMITAYVVAKSTANASCFAEIKTRANRYGSLDGVRGYLALSVFVHHFVITWHWKVHGQWQCPPISYVYNFGLVAVYLFFMITGFLFTYKLLAATRPISWKRLFLSRIFRIYPLYLVVVAAVLFIVMWQTHANLQVPLNQLVKEILKWLLYLGTPINDFQETSMIIAGVYWTLKYEWLFYLSLPLVFFLLRLSWLGPAILVALPVYFYIHPVTLHYFESKYFILFLAGGIAASVHRRIKDLTLNFNSLPANLITLSLFFAIFLYPVDLDAVHLLLMFCTFLMISNGNSLFGLLTSRPSLVLGEISYSIYLLHGLVLYISYTMLSIVDVAQLSERIFLMLAPATAAIVVIVCCFSYAFVEKPAISYGRKISG